MKNLNFYSSISILAETAFCFPDVIRQSKTGVRHSRCCFYAKMLRNCMKFSKFSLKLKTFYFNPLIMLFAKKKLAS